MSRKIILQNLPFTSGNGAQRNCHPSARRGCACDHILSTLTGISVSVGGTIMFAGLIVPHFMRLTVGADHRILLPGSFLAGAAFLTLCDVIARTVIAPLELPVGVITGIIGPNGTGKTTLLKTLCGVLPPRQGEIYIKGEEIRIFKIHNKTGRSGRIEKNLDNQQYFADKKAFTAISRNILLIIETILDALFNWRYRCYINALNGNLGGKRMSSYNIDFSMATSVQIEAALCKRLESIRLSRNITQVQLAEEAGVSPRTIGRLEKGQGVSMDTFIRIMMALNIHQNLEALLPDPAVRPIERIGIGAGERKRARPTQYSTESPVWSWGDGEVDDE